MGSEGNGKRPQRLFAPAKIAQYNFEQFLRMIEGLSPEQIEVLITKEQISQVTKAAWREGLDPKKLTGTKVDELGRYGGTDHPDPWV